MISAGPSVASLLAGKTLVVLKESMENILANVGVSSQGGAAEFLPGPMRAKALKAIPSAKPESISFAITTLLPSN
jgi:hypothetical protein